MSGHRTIIQISTGYVSPKRGLVVFALCNDGTLWHQSAEGGTWHLITGVPGDTSSGPGTCAPTHESRPHD